MHEVGLVQTAVAQALDAAQRAGARRVERLTFRVAADGHVTSEMLHTLVEAIAHGTLIQGAAIELVPTGSAELELVSIDVDVDAVCVA